MLSWLAVLALRGLAGQWSAPQWAARPRGLSFLRGQKLLGHAALGREHDVRTGSWMGDLIARPRLERQVRDYIGAMPGGGISCHLPEGLSHHRSSVCDPRNK